MATALRYSLKVSGLQLIGGPDNAPARFVPHDVAPVRITLAGPGGNSQMSFTVEDPKNPGSAAAKALPDGAVVSFQDTVSTTGISFKGVLLDRDQTPRAGGVGQFTAVTAAGLDWYFDAVDITRAFKSRTDTGVRIMKYTNDDAAVKGLLQHVGLQSFSSSFIQQTATDLDDFHLGIDMSTRDALDELADMAQPTTGATRNSTRRYYLDGDGLLHWYAGNEGLVPPCRFADGSYLENLIAASGVKAIWSGNLLSSTTLQDHMNYATATLNGGYTTGVASLCLNELQLPAFTLNGTTGYATASGANLHPGDTWSVGFVFKRGATQGTAQTVISAGTNDYQIGFDTTNHITVIKEGTGNNVASTTTYTSTTLTYYVVVTRTPGTTTIYVNGVDVTGTPTARTFSAAAGAVNIGRKLSTTNEFYTGTLWGVFVSSSTLSGSAVTALYNQWQSLTPENLHVNTGSAGVRKKGYIRGAPGYPQGAGPFPDGTTDAPPAQYPSEFGNGSLPDPVTVIDRPGSKTVASQRRAGRAFLSANNSPTRSVTFSVTYDPTQVNIASTQTSLKPGQLIRITQAAVGLSADAYEIKQVDIDLNMGNGVATFDVTAGALRYSANRRMSQRPMKARS